MTESSTSTCRMLGHEWATYQNYQNGRWHGCKAFRTWHRGHWSEAKEPKPKRRPQETQEQAQGRPW